MTTSSNPRKRQILAADQPVITSYFKPAVPAAVESALLHVGMRVRKSVPEGYKSGTYAYNKHLPGVLNPIPRHSDGDSFSPTSSQESNASTSSSTSFSKLVTTKKRSYDDEETDEKLPQPPMNITQWARAVKIPTGAGGGKANGKKRGFHQAVERKDIKTLVNEEDFEEADFLKMEE
jgi:hypothetical protein